MAFGKKDHEHEPAHEHAEPAHDAPSPAMARGAFMQQLHRIVDSYAEHWDEGRAGTKKDNPAPATEKAWLQDFGKYLQAQHSQP